MLTMRRSMMRLLVFFCTCALWAQTETVDLFNGKDLTGWEVYGTELWYVDEGDLVCESGPDAGYGYLGTKKHIKITYSPWNLNKRPTGIVGFSFVLP